MDLRSWYPARWLRLLLALVFLFAAIASRDAVAYAAAGFFGLQAFFNVGCCGMSTCNMAATKGTRTTTERITHEEMP